MEININVPGFVNRLSSPATEEKPAVDKTDGVGATGEGDLTITETGGTTGTGEIPVSGTPELEEPTGPTDVDMSELIGRVLDSVNDRGDAGLLILYHVVLLMLEALREQKESMRIARETEYVMAQSAIIRQAEELQSAAVLGLAFGIASGAIQFGAAVTAIASASVGMKDANQNIKQGKELNAQKSELGEVNDELIAIRKESLNASNDQNNPAKDVGQTPGGDADVDVAGKQDVKQEGGNKVDGGDKGKVDGGDKGKVDGGDKAEGGDKGKVDGDKGVEGAEEGKGADKSDKLDKEERFRKLMDRKKELEGSIEIDEMTFRTSIQKSDARVQLGRAISDLVGSLATFTHTMGDYVTMMGQTEAKLEEAGEKRADQLSQASSDMVNTFAETLAQLLGILQAVHDAEHDANSNIIHGI